MNPVDALCFVAAVAVASLAIAFGPAVYQWAERQAAANAAARDASTRRERSELEALVVTRAIIRSAAPPDLSELELERWWVRLGVAGRMRVRRKFATRSRS